MVPTLGAVPSPKDYRDIPLAAAGPGPALPVAHFEDISTLPRWHQRKIGACVGHAAAKYKQRLDQVETGTVIPYSARFSYAQAKCEDGYSGEGTYPRTVAKNFKEFGCATETTSPNDTTLEHEAYVYFRKSSNIPAAAFDEAGPAKIKSYAFPNPRVANELKRAIVESHGAMLLMQVGEEWWTAKDGRVSWAAVDVLPIRAPKLIVSGHEVYLYGYEDVLENGVTRTKFYILNSWSEDWGNKGAGWFYFDEYSPWLIEAVTFIDLPNEVLDQVHKLPSAADFKHQFKFTIKAGDRGAEVVALQTVLMIEGFFSKTLYGELLASGDLGYYKPGGVTQQSVLAFQIAHAVAPLPEIIGLNGASVGPKTRAALNALASN